MMPSPVGMAFSDCVIDADDIDHSAASVDFSLPGNGQPRHGVLVPGND
jgi:hypothetical protein